MNRRERRYGRMYLPPLLLGLTGIALLVLAWVLEVQSAGGAGALDSALRAGSFRDVFLHSGLLKSLGARVRPSCVILILPAIRLVLYLIRIPPKYARIAAGVSLALALFHLVIALYCGSHTPTPLCLRVPGYGLLANAKTLRTDKSFGNVLLTCSDAAFVLSSVSGIFSCLVYSFVKAHSDRRNAAFDQRNAYLIRPALGAEPLPEPEPAEPEPETAEPVLPTVSDEPTRVLDLPEDFSHLPEDFPDQR